MSSAALSNDEFFIQLAALIAKTQSKGHGSVHLTQKRRTYQFSFYDSRNAESNTTLAVTFDSSTPSNPSEKVADDPLWDLNPPQPLPLIVRATDGQSQNQDRGKNKEKVKLSTVVQPDDVDTFFARYAEVCKAGMQSLKKRDRSKRKKDKGKKMGKGGAAEGVKKA